MIGVIADDLTGAAEIGGVGWRHGWDVEILMQPELAPGGEMVIHNTDSRGNSPPEAGARVRRAVRALAAAQPTWIYKKIDSVLRGPVIAEVEAALAELGLKRALIVPANPSRGRVIRDGRYLVGEQLLNETDFRNDPTHPRHTAEVRALVGGTNLGHVSVRRPEESLAAEGIVIGEAADSDDLRRWAAQVDRDCLCVGGADFFEVLMEEQHPRADVPPRASSDEAGIKRVFVCGTASQGRDALISAATKHGVQVFSIPKACVLEAADSAPSLDGWVTRILESLQRNRAAALVIGQPLIENLEQARRVGECLVRAAKRIADSIPRCQLHVEGGATASSLLERLEWSRLRIEDELSPGIVCVSCKSSPTLRMVLKPGSYVWPEAVWSTP